MFEIPSTYRDPFAEVGFKPRTLIDLLRWRAQHQPDKLAYTFLGKDDAESVTLTYRELDRQARAIGSCLQPLVADGDRVLLLYPPGLEFVSAFFGCLYVGAIAVPAYPPRRNRNLLRLQAIVADAGAMVALTTASVLSRVAPVFAQNPYLQPLRWLASDQVEQNSGESDDEPALIGSSTAFLQYTSGSTGTPKGVILTHDNLLHNASFVYNACEHTAEDSYVSWLPTFHDMGFMAGVLQPLYAGIPVVQISPIAFLQSPVRWLQVISQMRATVSGAPNFAYDLCVRKTTAEQRASLDLSSWTIAFNGAEPIRGETLERFIEAFAPSGFRRETFYPCYGLAEATLMVSGSRKAAPPVAKFFEASCLEDNRVEEISAGASAARPLVGCGRSWLEQKVVIVDPKALTVCESDTVGEVWVSGPSVAQGYWNRPDETAEIFMAQLAETDEGPFLRTGDLGFLQDGELFITGRIKDLIIIRGLNHYPQDIELTVERCHPSMRAGCGAALSVSVNSDERLVIVQELDQKNEADAGEIIELIRQQVAEEHEVQAYAVLLIKPGTIPKTSSGKIQRHACRAGFLECSLEVLAEWRATLAPEEESAAEEGTERLEDLPVPADSEAEMAAWFQTELARRLRVRVDEIDVTQPMTRYGLDSLVAIELMHSIESRLGISLPMVGFMQSPSIKELAAEACARLSIAAASPGTRLTAATETNIAHSLSHGQQALWFLHQLSPQSTAYTIANAVRISSELNVEALQRAWQALLDRHASLRTTFTAVHGKPSQFIHQNVNLSFQEFDASDWSAPALVARLSEEAHRPFDLEAGPLLRLHLFRRSAREHVLLLAVHHIVVDLWSLSVLMDELGKLYQAELDDVPAMLPNLVLQYTDYVRWQEELFAGPEAERLWSYWQTQLAGELPALDLPTDRPRPPVQSYRGAAHCFRLDAELTKKLKTLGRTHGTTLYMTLLASFQTLLHRYTHQEDLTVGSPTVGRNWASLAGVVGYFINPVVLRANFAGNPTFEEFLLLVRQTVLSAFEHQDYPFSVLVERLQPVRDPSRSPLFQAMFVLQKSHLLDEVGLSAFALGEPDAQMHLGPLTLEALPLEQRVAQFDLTLMMVEVAGELVASMEYNTDLFDEVTIQRMAWHFQTLLEGIVASPAQRLSDLPLLDDDEEDQILVRWNDARVEYPAGKCLHHLIEQQAKRTPQDIAVVFEDERLTYAELNERADRLAIHLQGLGVGPEALVPILMERSPQLLVGILAILKAGGAYVPLDPAYPRERLAFMLEDTGASVLLTQRGLAREFADHVAQVVYLDEELSGFQESVRAQVASGCTSQNLAYVIYTSGSTGKPKGVAITHQNAVVFLSWAQTIFERRQLAGVLASTSICFDLSVFELFAPLACGGKVILVRDILELGQAPAAAEVTLINTVPSAMTELLRLNAVPASVQTVNLAGEPLQNSLVQQIYQQTPVEQVWNLYGPTEDTTYSTYTLVDRGAERQPTIGRPVANTQVYLLGQDLRLVPVGVAGELYLGGDGLARGYLNRPDLTAERFIPKPFAQEAGAVLYRTGDLARYRLDGEIEYLGRVDHQVKLRGFRIELGEIKAALGSEPGVRDCVVIVREDVAGDKRLVAYLVAEEGQTLKSSELRSALKEQLPEYMMPSAFVVLDEIPLTPNGKINRQALPPPRLTTRDELGEERRPRTLVEEMLAVIWQDVLRLEAVGFNENFFELGGHSLLATQVVSRIRELFTIEIPVRSVFESPTIAGLAAAIEELRQAGRNVSLAPMLSVGREEHLPLSFAQQRLWFLDQLEPGNSLYNIPAALRLHGRLNLSALEQSLNEIVRRHESLRTTFIVVNGQPVQAFSAPQHFALPIVDLGELPASERRGQADALALEEMQKPFDLAVGPLMRIALLRLDDEEYVLLLAMHHIISDGWSLGVLLRELTTIYEAYAAGEPSPFTELPIQYADYAHWQRNWSSGQALSEQRRYWRQQLAGAPFLLELPTDKQRPAVQTFRGAQCSLELPAELSQQLKELSQHEGVTLFMLLLATFQLLLSRWSGQEDVMVGTPIAGRRHLETEGLIGFFVNTLVLRTDVSGELSVRQLLERVREICIGAYANQDVPFEKLVEDLQPDRSLSHSPLFQVLFVLQYAAREAAKENKCVGALSLTPLKIDTATAKFDLTLLIEERESGLVCDIEYNTDLFEAATIQRLLGHYAQLLSGMAEDPAQPLSKLSLLTTAERRQVLSVWNETSRDFGPPLTLHQMFEAQVERTPQAVALVFENQQLTYCELEERSNQLANYLRSLGVGPEVRVGIMVERSLEMVIGLLGILKAGGAYVPLDPDYPQDRLAFMLADAKVPVLLTQSHLLDRLPARPPQVINLDREWDVIAQQSTTRPVSNLSGDNLAYMIYTSGSTGKPKGVMNSHAAIYNRLCWIQEMYPLTAADRVLQKTPFSFDVSVWEFFWPLMAGAPLVLARPDGHRDSAYLVELIKRERITILHFVPAMLQVFLAEEDVESCVSLRRVICSGEALSRELQDRFFSRLGGVQLHNLYGPTEAAVEVTAWECDPASSHSSVPIGRPIANTHIYLLDQYQQPVPAGVPGELNIGGVQVARGYHSRADLSAERFVPDAFSGVPGSRLYRTGDLARYLSDGSIEYLGRLDHQVKIRGFRIELGEIEAVLAAHPAVREAIVLAREDAPGEKRLVAYVLFQGEYSLTSSQLSDALKEQLPDYMVPTAFVILDEMPVTPNGKVDRRRLPMPEQNRPKMAEEYLAPRTPVEEVVAGLWAEVLGIERVGIEDNFFDLGGHSLLATQVISRIRKAFQVEVPLRSLFEEPTVAGLAARIEGLCREDGGVQMPSLQRMERGPELELSFTQQRLWFLDQLEPGNPAFNISATMRLTGVLNLQALRLSLEELFRRHESLRTTIETRPYGPRQEIAERIELVLPLTDLSQLPAPERDTHAQAFVEQEAQLPFTLSLAPLLRLHLLRLEDNEHLLLFTIHHIISDGWSLGILIRELRELYTAALNGERELATVLEPLHAQYADYAIWQRQWLSGETLAAQEKYWREQLQGAAPVLELPTDFHRPPVQTFNGASESIVLPGDLSASLKSLSRRESVTLFMTLLAAFKILLSRYTGQEDIVVGAPIAGRDHAEIENLIGFFVNSLALRTDLSGNPSFRELLQRVREVTLGAYAHQSLPFEKLLEALQPERSQSHTPIFQVYFNMLNFPEDKFELPGLCVETFFTPEVGSKFDLTLYIKEQAEEIKLVLVYNSDLFRQTRMTEMLAQFQHLLKQIVSEPTVELAHLSLVTSHAQTLLPDPGQELSGKWEGAISSLFAQQAERAPDHLAVVDKAERWTYGELEMRSNQLANYLLSSGVRKADVVVIYAHRNASLVWALLGILKAGAAFTILDPAYPAARSIECLRQAQPRGWLHIDAAGPLPDELERYVAGLRLRCRMELPGRTTAAARHLLSEHPSDAPAVVIEPNDLAYIAFTSGSTGKPKGVLGRHGPLTHFVPWLRKTFDLNSADRYSMLSGLSHDPLHRDVFTPLQLGATICVPDTDEIAVPGKIAAWLRDEQVTIAHLTPAMAQLITEGVFETFAGQATFLRYAFLVGDVLTRHDVARLRCLAPAMTCINYYGTTETQRAVGYFIVGNNAERANGGKPSPVEKEVLPLGRGIEDVQLLVLNGRHELAGVGERGEIYLRSPHLARGYLNDAALTAERFMTNHFTGDSFDRLYKTGDLGSYLPDGTVESLGRSDFQVKIRGYRIELGEIEAVLQEHHAVREVIALVRADLHDEKRLVAYVVPAKGESVAAADLRLFLKQRLPEYMVPSAFVMLERLPLTPNGKVNRAALPAPDQDGFATEHSYIAPRTPLEEQLTGLWRDVLGVDSVGIEDDFFALGGHSLLAAQLLNRMRATFQVELPLRRFFEAANVKSLAVAILQEQSLHVETDELAGLLAELERISEVEAEALLS